MNEKQYFKWKRDTSKAMVESGVYTTEQAGEIVDWFDSIKGSTERRLFGDALLDALCDHWKPAAIDFFVYKTLTARAWLYADKILELKGL